jgi:hypothetical protein
LSAIGGVGDYFLITGHTGVENYFRVYFPFGSKMISLEDFSIGQR